MSILDRLRDRWGGGIRPYVGTDKTMIERRDWGGEGPASSVEFEGFGLSIIFIIGRTPPRYPESK